MSERGGAHTTSAVGAFAVWVLAGWTVCGAGQAPPTPPPSEEAAIAACLAKLPAGAQVAVAVLDRDATRFLGAERTAEDPRPVDNRSALFQIGSITKVFTATLLAQEVVAGRLALADPVARHLPFPLHVSGRGGVEVTLEQLASHTSGIAHHQPPGVFRHALLHFHPDEPTRDFDRARFEAYLRENLELSSTPGTAYLYSNLGMSLVGLVLELETGRGYEALLQERIFRPLGMMRSTADVGSVRERLVPGLKPNGARFPAQEMAALRPAGGICSTAEDMARFARAQLEASDPAIALTQRPVFTVGEGERVALGWHLYDWVQGWHTLNHNGAIGGYTATVNVDREHRLATIVLANVMNEDEAGEAVRELGRALLRRLEAR